MAAISISNTVDTEHAEGRAETYAALVSKYNQLELACLTSMFGEVINGLDENPDLDFLGHFDPYAHCIFLWMMSFENCANFP